MMSMFKQQTCAALCSSTTLHSFAVSDTRAPADGLAVDLLEQNELQLVKCIVCRSVSYGSLNW